MPRPQKPVIWLLMYLHSAIEAQMTSVPETTIAELRDWLLHEHDFNASIGTAWNTLSRLGLTKRSRSAQPNKPVPILSKPGASGANYSLT